MKGRKVSIDIIKANVFAVVLMTVLGIAFLVLFILIWKGRKPTDELIGGFPEWSILFALMLVGVIVHELIHGLTWACYAKSGWNSISFGVIWWLLTKENPKSLVLDHPTEAGFYIIDEDE